MKGYNQSRTGFLGFKRRRAFQICLQIIVLYFSMELKTIEKLKCQVLYTQAFAFSISYSPGIDI